MRKPRTRKDMVEYLTSHYRYDTMNSWNESTSYARAIKVRSVEVGGRRLTREEQDACYEMLDVEGSFEESGWAEILHDFDKRYNHSYQIWSNGRSGGYLVLGQGGSKPSEHKSYCRACGQRNFTAVEQEVAPQAGDPGKPGKCGRCNRMTRYNADFAPDTFAYPGKSLDQGEDFSDWDMYSLRNRVDLVWDFDQTVDAALKAYLAYAMQNKVEERIVKVPKHIKVAVPKQVPK